MHETEENVESDVNSYFQACFPLSTEGTYAEKKKYLQLFHLIGIALLALGFLFFPLIVPAEFLFADTIALATGMIVAGVGVFLCIYMSGLVRAYRLLLMNEIYQQKRK